MSLLSLSYGLFLIIGMIVYYSIPKKGQWIVLLLLGMFFYGVNTPKGSVFLLFSIFSSWLYGRYCDRLERENKSSLQGKNNLSEEEIRKRKKLTLLVTIGLNVSILLLLKVFIKLPFIGGFALEKLGMFVPLGISFYTLQIITYMVDVYRGKIGPEKNLFRYGLFVSFFPQILQGPIPRFDKLAPQFEKEHKFDYLLFTDSLMLMLWGFFQKMVIADNAAVVVNRVFGEYQTYQGFYVVLAAFLYSIQLYADFSGCVNIAMGSAGLFGIQLDDNFRHPYFSCSIREFWGRWHISLSSFLKEYIYIPLGGNRKGRIRKYVNLLLTFLISGIWHGAGLTFLVWGFLHGMYQMIEDVCKPWLIKLMNKIHVNMENFSFRLLLQIKTFVLVAVAWVFFRADSVKQALFMLKSVVTGWNPYVLLDESFYLLGLGGREFRMLMLSIFVLCLVSFLQERMHLREVFRKQNLLFQWIVLLLGIFAVLIFGVYGPGYDAAQFIYGNF